MAETTFTCDRCGNEFEISKLKEVMYESGQHREKKRLCPSCLDITMNESKRVRGIVGDEKAAAIHIDGGGEDTGERQSLSERGEKAIVLPEEGEEQPAAAAAVAPARDEEGTPTRPYEEGDRGKRPDEQAERALRRR